MDNPLFKNVIADTYIKDGLENTHDLMLKYKYVDPDQYSSLGDQLEARLRLKAWMGQMVAEANEAQKILNNT